MTNAELKKEVVLLRAAVKAERERNVLLHKIIVDQDFELKRWEKANPHLVEKPKEPRLWWQEPLRSEREQGQYG